MGEKQELKRKNELRAELATLKAKVAAQQEAARKARFDAAALAAVVPAPPLAPIAPLPALKTPVDVTKQLQKERELSLDFMRKHNEHSFETNERIDQIEQALVTEKQRNYMLQDELLDQKRAQVLNKAHSP